MKIKKRFIAISLLVLFVGLAIYPTPENKPIQYIERSSGEIKTERVAGENWLIWLYNNPVGELTLYAMVRRKFASAIYGSMMDSEKSVNKISTFVKEYNIDLSIAQKKEYTSFNDFFGRKLKKEARPVNMDSNVVCSPGDGKILAFADIQENDFIVKGKQFDVKQFLRDSILAKKYLNGSLIILRLCPTDYHRFHFPVNGMISPTTKVNGYYYSVNPIALEQRIEIFFENKREYVQISTIEFGEIILAEVGATMVGSIIQTYKGNVAIKGEEKGYFKFGGSTLVLMFEKGKVCIDEDLIMNSQNLLETEVKMGERIASQCFELQ